MIFFIDFENVHSNGFMGIENLTEADKIIIFYPNNATISLDVHRKLEVSDVIKEYVQVNTGSKNSLDFQLSTYLGYAVATNPDDDFYIVSKDNGYSFVEEFWKARDIKVNCCTNLLAEAKVNQILSITQYLPDYSDEEHKFIFKIIGAYKTKQGINNALVKRYGTDETGKIYKAIKPLLKDKKGT